MFACGIWDYYAKIGNVGEIKEGVGAFMGASIDSLVLNLSLKQKDNG